MIEGQATRRGVKVHALNPGSWGRSSDGFVKRLASDVIDKFQIKGELTISAIFAKMRIACDPALVDMVAEEVLRQMADAGPAALLVDEAHRLPPDIAERKHILNEPGQALEGDPDQGGEVMPLSCCVA